MPPPRASSADAPPQSASAIASAIEDFLAQHPEAAILEDGKVLFDLRSTQHTLSTDHDRCTLHLWNDERNLVRRIVSAQSRADTLRLTTLRFGQTQTKLIELVTTRNHRTPTTRDTARTRYLRLLERSILPREFPDHKPLGFRTAMDLERSFGPAYARGSLVRGNHAWAVIAVNDAETATTIDGILTLGILWLHHCREHAGGRRLYQGLRVIVPRGTATLTLSRLAWLNPAAAQWQLFELHQPTEALTPRDPGDQGNLRTRLIHHPDEASAAERFRDAIAQVHALIPPSEHHRIDHRLRSTAELSFQLHGLEFARARLTLAPNSFAHRLEITAGAGPAELPLTPSTRGEIAAHLADLFARRHATPIPDTPTNLSSRPQDRSAIPTNLSSPPESQRSEDGVERPASTSQSQNLSSRPSRRIGAATHAPAHSRLQHRTRADTSPTQDPLYRAAPERWLESVLRRDLTPLTRSLAPAPRTSPAPDDPDTLGNRADPEPPHIPRAIPRLDPAHVYTQVPAIAGASDRGLLDLLGVTADGRLAVIELKADDDLHFALQGLDYWIRVRHHHLATTDPATSFPLAPGEFQRHGYFRNVTLSPQPPRLYLVAPALHVHPATETILRYLSPHVEWQLLALDERWRQHIRVLWRRESGPRESKPLIAPFPPPKSSQTT